MAVAQRAVMGQTNGPERRKAFPDNLLLDGLTTVARTLPCAAGLERVFLLRTPRKKLEAAGVLVEELKNNETLLTYNVMLDGKEVGKMFVLFYEKEGFTVTAHITYQGIVPKPGNLGFEKVILIADSRKTLTFNPDNPRIEEPDLKTSNNTKENPIKRHDEYRLISFADFEKIY